MILLTIVMINKEISHIVNQSYLQMTNQY